MAATLLDSPSDLTLTRAVLQALSEVTILGEGDFPAATGCDGDHTDSVSDENSLGPMSPFDSIASGGSSSRSGVDSVYSGDAEEQVDQETNLCRLKRMFPSLLEQTLTNALKRASGGRVEAAVDELLNRVFIDGGAQEGEEDAIKDQSPAVWRGVGKSIDGFWADEAVGTKGSSKRNRRRNGHIAPQEQLGAWRAEPPPSPTSLDASVGNGVGLGSGDCVRGASRWTILQRDISYLSAALHIPQKKVASAFHACGLDIAETVYRLVDELPPHLSTERHPPDPEEVEVLQVLRESFPVIDDNVARSLWWLVVGRQRHADSPKTASLAIPISTPVSPVNGPITGWSVTGRGGFGGGLGGGGWSVTGRGGGHRHSRPWPPAPSQPVYPQTPEEAESAISHLWTIAAILQNASRHAPILPSPAAPPDIVTSTLTRPSQTRQPITINPRHTTTPASTHNLTSLTTSLRHALSSSAEASRRANSRNNFAAAAAHYSLHARELTDSIREMQVMRALETVTPLLDEDDGVTVDLHGLRLAEGVRVAREVVEGFFSAPGGGSSSNVYYPPVRSQRLTRRRAVVRVITGKGKHSRDGRGVLGPGVVKMLRGEGWKVEVGNGWVEVTGKERRR